ncbi:MAG: S8 family serine peptidase [Chloroflexota bacterium]
MPTSKRRAARYNTLIATAVLIASLLIGSTGVQARPTTQSDPPTPSPFAFGVSFLSPTGQVGTTYHGAPQGATALVSADANEMAAQALAQINAARQAHDLPPLAISAALTGAAATHAADLLAHNTFAHRGADGSWPADRVVQHGHPATYLGENLAGGFATAQETVDAWLADGGSQANLLDAHFTHAGLALAHNGPWHNYWVLLLADPPAYRHGRVLVRFQPTVAATSVRQVLTQVGATSLGRIGSLEVQQLAVPVGQEAAVVAALQQNSGVAFAELDRRVQIVTDPDDPGYSGRWWWDKIQAPEAWDVTTGSPDVIIAVIDTGVDLDHPDLAAKLVDGYDFANLDTTPDDDHGHGTHVAGITAAVTDNSLGVAGLAWQASIMPVKVLDSSGSGWLSDVAGGIVYAADNGAQVINLSLGGPDSDSTLSEAIDHAHDQGVFIAAAAGNNGNNTLLYPAAEEHVVGVAATDSGDARAYFSNYGAHVDIAAPGVSIYSTYPGSYATMSGTSMATPFVAGLAALLFALDADLTPDDIETILADSAHDLGPAGRDDYFGWGRIDAYAAVAAASPKTLEGAVLSQDGRGVAGVQLTIQGSQTYTAATNADGFFRYDDLPRGSYTVTPSLADLTFSPASRDVTLADADASSVAFTAEIAETFTLSGTVQSSDGNGWPDVSVSITSQHLQTTVTTDALGRFAQRGLIGDSYSIAPAAEGHAFWPASAVVTVGDAPVSTQDFQVTAFFVRGAVSTTTGLGVPGVLLTLNEVGSAAPMTRTTDNNGLFSFSGVVSGTYVLTPTLSNATFDPPTRTVTVTTANVTGMDFIRQDYALFLPVGLRHYSDVVYPNDPYFDDQWGLHNTGKTGGLADADIDAPEAWGLSRGDSDVILAVIDTGVDLDHPEFAGRLTAGWDYVNDDGDPDDDEGHGTHVAGIAAAAGDNGSGVAGVAWNVRIMPIKVLDSDGEGYLSDVADGIRYAADNGAKVVNLSLGGSSDNEGTLQTAANYAYARGVLLVAASGNNGTYTIVYPAGNAHVLGVASTDNNDNRSQFSNYGPHVDVAAPGSDIYSTAWVGDADPYCNPTVENPYCYKSGTSMATPFVAGLAALILSRYPSYTPDQVADAIVHNADDLGAAGRDDLFGCGRINAYASLRYGAVSSGCSGWGGLSVESVEALAAPLANAEFRPGVLLVGFKDTAAQAERESVLAAHGLTTLRIIDGPDIHIVAVPEGQELALSETLQADPAVAYAEPDYKVYALP